MVLFLMKMTTHLPTGSHIHTVCDKLTFIIWVCTLSPISIQEWCAPKLTQLKKVITCITHFLVFEPQKVTREFDASDFSFHKVKGTGFYSQFVRETSSSSSCQPVSLQSSMIMPNIFPIGLYSSLFVPYFFQNLPQVLTQEVLSEGVHFAQTFQSNDWRLGFNSLSAWASVNHLHFQFWKRDHREKKQIMLESSPTKLLKTENGVRFSHI